MSYRVWQATPLPQAGGRDPRMLQPVPNNPQVGPPHQAYYQNPNPPVPGPQINFTRPPLNLQHPPPSNQSSYPNHMSFPAFSTPPPNQFHTNLQHPPPHSGTRADVTMGAGMNTGMPYMTPPPYRAVPPGDFQKFPPGRPFQQNSGFAQSQPQQMPPSGFQPPVRYVSERRPGLEKFDDSTGKKSQPIESGEKQIGSQLLLEWLQKNRKQKRPPKKVQKRVKPEMPVWKHIEQLSAVTQLITDMSAQVKEMERVMATEDSSSFEERKIKLEDMKKKFLDLKPVTEESSVVEMEKHYTKLRMKRARLKQSRKEHWEKQERLKEVWEEKGKEIDRWQERHRAQIKEENKKKARKAAADRTLSKVTREIQDATRLIETMLSLQKLRLIRRDAAQKRGDTDLGESRQAFEQKITDMTRLVQAQLECYKEEEAKLKQVIKSEQEETSKKERLVQLENEERKRKEEDEELEVILFGPQEQVTDASPLFPYDRFYKQAEHSLEAFVQIRNEWDMFIVPEETPASSSIPSSWVVPVEPNNSVWAGALT